MPIEEKDDKGNGKEKPYVPEFDVVEVDPNKAKNGVAAEQSDAGYADERLSASQRVVDDDAGDDPEEVVVDDGSQTEEEIERKRSKRRAERKAQKNRQHQARERDKRELGYLRIRNEQVEKRLLNLEKSTNTRATQTELAVVEGRMQQLTAAQAECDSALAAAVEAQNGADAAKLTRAQGDLRDGLARLAAYQARLKAAPAQKATAEQEEDHADEQVDRSGGQDQSFRVSPGVVKNAGVFTTRHQWVNPSGGDRDSNIVKVLDAEVLEEGYDPATKEYWQELESRMQEVLPHRFKGSKANGHASDDEDEETPPARRNGAKPNGGPRMPTNSQNRGGNGQKFYLSAERKQAMIEAGVWDDPVLRDKQLRQFQKWDVENADLLKSGR